MNPILPLYYAAPDGEAHVWKTNPDRMYPYASNDRIDGGGMDPWQNVWSSEDLVNWTDHGIRFDGRTACSWTSLHGLPAIDVIEKDGKSNLVFYCECLLIQSCTLTLEKMSRFPISYCKSALWLMPEIALY